MSLPAFKGFSSNPVQELQCVYEDMPPRKAMTNDTGRAQTSNPSRWGGNTSFTRAAHEGVEENLSWA